MKVFGSTSLSPISINPRDSGVMEVPTKTRLADIYPEDAVERQTKRWNQLVSTFKETYGKLPDFISRSPGRVNVIGEV